MVELNKIYNEDCMVTLKRIPDNYLDLVVTSPPYNVKKDYKIYNDDKEFVEYLDWLKLIFSEIYNKLYIGGRVCVNIGDGKNGALPVSMFLQKALIDIGYSPITRLVWNKNQVKPRTSWGSFKSPSSPSFPTPFEYILVFAKESRKLIRRGETDLTKKEFIKWSSALWTIAPETRQKKFGHSAMFPEELVERCLKMFSWIDGIVYDPFMGVGTVAKCCRDFNRYFIGSEISEEYCKKIEERLGE